MTLPGKCYPKLKPHPFKILTPRIKHVENKNGATAFLSINGTGGILRCDQILTEKELKHVYKGIDPKKGVKIRVTELTEDKNTYQKGIVADINQNKTTKAMESWSILSDHVKYVQHDESDILHNFDSLNYHVNEDIYKELKEQEMLKTSIDFSGMSEKLKSDYLDVYD